jgi:hypothetical protein
MALGKHQLAGEKLMIIYRFFFINQASSIITIYIGDINHIYIDKRRIRC